MTHLHRDHVGWNLRAEGQKYVPTFPRARYWTSVKDWETCHQPDVQPALFVNTPTCVWPLAELGLIEFMQGEHSLTRELTALSRIRQDRAPAGTPLLAGTLGPREENGRMRRQWPILCLALCLLTPAPTIADGFRLLNVGIRGGVDGPNVFGGDETEHFQQYDLFATVSLPWSKYWESGWGFSPRLMGTAGVIIGAGEAGFVGTIVPLLAFGRKDSALALDAGVGAAVLTRNKYGEQNFGGAFQMVLTFGLRIPVYGALGISYRMAHMSDAEIYGNGKGVDMHMLELTYNFR